MTDTETPKTATIGKTGIDSIAFASGTVTLKKIVFEVPVFLAA